MKVLPTDFLDFAVAYLRRIHYILYFSGRQCRDESQVLITASGIQFRSVPTTSSDEDPTASVSQSASASLSRASSRSHADDDDTDRRYDDEEDQEEQEGDQEEDQGEGDGEAPDGTVATTNDKKEPAENEKSNQESTTTTTTTTETKAPLKWIRKNSPLDKRIDDIMEASKARSIRNKAPLGEKPPGSIDDEEADAIAAEAQKVRYTSEIERGINIMGVKLIGRLARDARVCSRTLVFDDIL